MKIRTFSSLALATVISFLILLPACHTQKSNPDGKVYSTETKPSVPVTSKGRATDPPKNKAYSPNKAEAAANDKARLERDLKDLRQKQQLAEKKSNVSAAEIERFKREMARTEEQILRKDEEARKAIEKKEVAFLISEPSVSEEIAEDSWGGEMDGAIGFDDETEPTPSDYNTEAYAHIEENDFTSPKVEPLSTFSIDVDVASYANMRRFLNSSQMPYPGAVRIEEMINYFTYDYPQPKGGKPFSITTELGACPWNTDHQLVHVGLQGKNIDRANLPASNLVFLMDVSGSMNNADKLPLLKQAFKMLVNNLDEDDRIAIVVYAGAAGVVLPSTSASKQTTILDALDKLNAGGSTAGGAGIELAYKVAKENFIKGGNNRVILATDGDFNVGASSESALVKMIEEKRKDGVFLSVLGFGTGNYQDSRMEQLADKGNGNYAYIDNILEAQKVLVKEMGGTLFAIAKDVKIQIEFNPSLVKGYRLIGYENRMMEAQDFNDDTKDAGELGAGHTVTAIYEIAPVGSKTQVAMVDDLKYQKAFPENTSLSSELMTVKFRYKKPDGDTSTKIEQTLNNTVSKTTSENFRHSAAVASFGMILRGSAYKGNADYNTVLSLAKGAKGTDPNGYRAEFIQLVEKANLLDTRKPLAKKE